MRARIVSLQKLLNRAKVGNPDERKEKRTITGKTSFELRKSDETDGAEIERAAQAQQTSEPMRVSRSAITALSPFTTARGFILARAVVFQSTIVL